MTVYNDRSQFLFSGVSAEITGSAIDTRIMADYAYVWYQASGESAIFNIEASHDATGWMTVIRRTATATQTGTAQIAAYYPYIRGNITELWTATGVGGTATGVLWVHFSPGIYI